MTAPCVRCRRDVPSYAQFWERTCGPWHFACWNATHRRPAKWFRAPSERGVQVVNEAVGNG